MVPTNREETPLQGAEERERFEQALLPHMDAAYNLARWLTRDDHDAEDLVQAAYLRALKFFGGFRGANSRSWLLTIVRNTCYTWLDQKRARGPQTALAPDDALISPTPDTPRPPSWIGLRGQE
jgi:DNA-directed RNA polymerase specialized sigma24 family protein